MRNLIRPVVGFVLSVGLAACGGHGASSIAQGPGGLGQQSATKQVLFGGAQISPNVGQVCGTALPGRARCFSLIRLDTPKVVNNFNPPGYHPADLLSAYKLDATKGAGQTEGIVDAFDDPNAEADLAVYRANFGLPACTTANGCFKKTDQRGGTSYPPPDFGWAEEMSLDLDMASAICPKCHILLVEGDDNSFLNLALAVDEAAKLGANTISNSYGGGEDGGQSGINGHYNHPGHMITASTGDSGYGPQFPAGSQFVTAVGGTSLFKGGGGTRGWHETVWSGSGSGCSAFYHKPSWQKDTGCSNRTIGDTAAVADPGTGVSVYDTYGLGGWNVFGGTSVASPIIGGVYALAGNASTLFFARYGYHHKTHLFDITSGSNGSCTPAYLCTGEVGYDGPTGNGTPNGDGAF